MNNNDSNNQDFFNAWKRYSMKLMKIGMKSYSFSIFLLQKIINKNVLLEIFQIFCYWLN